MITGLSGKWASNPRVVSGGQELEAEIRRNLPSLRQRVKQLLGNVDLNRYSLNASSAPARSVAASKGASGIRTPLSTRESAAAPNTTLRPSGLGYGLHSEVSLFDADLDWVGKADLIRLARDECSIFDFKSGAEKEDHCKQMLTYALLWTRDQRVNPKRVRVTNLSVVYSDKTVTFDPPDSGRIDQLANELAQRSDAAKRAVSQTPPPAQPSREACEWCDVRQLCGVYWDPSTRVAINAMDETTNHRTPSGRGSWNTADAAFALADLELAIVARQGEWSWHARILQTGALTNEINPGVEVLLRARPGDHFFGTLLSPGKRVRVIGAQVVEASEESANRPVAVLGRGTEAFLLPEIVRSS